jgi:prophage regulatory protein
LDEKQWNIPEDRKVRDLNSEQSRSEKLLRFPMVQERIPYSHSTIYLLIKLGKFPKPVSLGGRAVAWRESEINRWIQSRI